jgi:uncharacterized protein (TIGR03435 family)
MIAVAASILAKVTVTLVLALIATRLARRSRAAVRHVLLAAAFGVILVLPLASIVAPSVRVEVPIAAQAGVVPAPPGTLPEASSATSLDAGAVITPATPRPRWVSLPALLVTFWIAGAAMFVLPVAAGLWQIRTIRRSGLPWRQGRAIVDALALEAGIQRRVDVLLNESMPGPMTCGLVKPAIVLPVDAQKWPAEDLGRAIVHELEHVRRGDWISLCLARAVCACYWFHPLVWVAWRRLVLEAERACDDAVLKRAEATAYADQLVGLAQRLSTAKAPLLAMANRADLATRVVSVLDGTRARGRAGAVCVAVAMVASFLLVLTISPLTIVARAIEEQASPDTQKFDVVSIKKCENEPPVSPGQRSSQGGFPSLSPGRFFIECGTVERLISTAYVLNGEPLINQAARIGDVQWLKEVPGWVRSEKFTIEAKAEGTPDRRTMLGPMLRNLLEERFKLKIRRAMDEAPLYEMTVAKDGLKIRPIGEGDCTQLEPDTPPARGNVYEVLSGAVKPTCGVMTMANGDGQTRWAIGGTTLKNFSSTLSAFMDRHVTDKTGISGEFNIRLEFVRDRHIPGPDKRPRADAPGAAAAPEDSPAPDGPTIFIALEKQLGLKLEPARGPHGFLVIDHVERPSPNSGPGILEAPVNGKASGAGRAGQ